MKNILLLTIVLGIARADTQGAKDAPVVIADGSIKVRYSGTAPAAMDSDHAIYVIGPAGNAMPGQVKATPVLLASGPITKVVLLIEKWDTAARKWTGYSDLTFQSSGTSWAITPQVATFKAGAGTLAAPFADGSPSKVYEYSDVSPQIRLRLGTVTVGSGNPVSLRTGCSAVIIVSTRELNYLSSDLKLPCGGPVVNPQPAPNPKLNPATLIH